MKIFYFILVIFSWLINPMINFSQEGFNKAFSFNGATAVFLDVFALNNQIYVSAIITDTTGGIIQDVHTLYKTDFDGNAMDTIFLKLPYSYILQTKNTTLLGDSSVIATGNIYIPNLYTIIVYKYNSDSVQWIKQITDPNTSFPFFSKDVLTTADGSIYLLINYQENNYDVNTMVMKLRSNGEEIWRRKYGGGSHSEIANAFTAMPDGSILVGSCKSNFAHTSNFFDPELYPTWLFRIDTAGQLLNQWTNPDPMSWFPGALAPTPDGGIVYAGAYTDYHSNGDAVVVNSITKLSNFSNVDWNLKLNNTAGFNFIENLIIHNNYIYACGYEYDTTSIHNGTNEIQLQFQYGVLYKINLNGEIIFKYYYSVPLPLSESTGIHTPIPMLYSISIPNDSTLLMVGEIRVSFSPPQPTLPTQYGWLIKTNLQGCLAPNDCDYIALEELPHQPLLRVWPNPATDYLSLQVDEHWLYSQFSILNLQGQTLQRGTLEAPLTIFDVQNRPPGLYLLRLTKNGKEHTIKWIKQ